MRVILVGADFEENLGIGMIAAAALAAGHEAEVIPFDDVRDLDGVARRILACSPSVVGLSMGYQHRAHEFVSLARKLRALGFAGHVTCGGQWPTMAWREALEGRTGIDTVVLYDGERTFVELLRALEAGGPIEDVSGIALRAGRGQLVRTRPRMMETSLDSLPLPHRYRPHTRHMGIPFIPILGGRGCWGSCSYCSITACHRDARLNGAAVRTFRQRSVRNLAAEMAMLWHAAGGAGVFCFHDDNFLVPRPDDSLRRLREIRLALDEFGVGKTAFIGKCRPDCVTPELARSLRELGVVRMYVGVENASQRGADHLHRRMSIRAASDALDAFRQVGIFSCYNLLIFEPDATLDDVRENVAFMRRHADHPVNFCRAEPYHGTPLHKSLATKGILGGSHYGWDYRVLDDRTELLFRICSSSFREHNFAPSGVANRTMALGYSARLVEFFYDDPRGRTVALQSRARELTRTIVLGTAQYLEEAIAMAETVDPRDEDQVARRTARLGLGIAASDRLWHVAIDQLFADMAQVAREAGSPPASAKPTRPLLQALQGIAVAGYLAAGTIGCSGSVETDGTGGHVADPVPSDAGLDRDASEDIFQVDPAPWDAGRDARDGAVSDPIPPDAGVDADGDAARDRNFDDRMYPDPPPPDHGMASQEPPAADHWQDSSPRRTIRSRHMPLYAPPAAALVVRREGNRLYVRVEVVGAEPISALWQSEGEVIGQGSEVEWIPESPDDQIRVAVRSKGGVSIVSLRACEA